MNTQQLMDLALNMADLTQVPGDSAIHHPGEEIHRLLFGIDLKGPELKLAKDLGYDAAISHHPVGGASTLDFHKVLLLHIEQMTAAGVPAEVAETLMRETVESRRVLNSMTNYDHDPSIARLLNMPYVNIHTPLDEIGRRRMADAVGELSPASTIEALREHLLSSFGEFRNAATQIEVRVGCPENTMGRAVVAHGAGTNGGYPVAKAYFDHGIDTVIYIHCRPDDAKKLRQEYGESKTLLVTGHIASDSVGINPYIDRLRHEGIEVDTISGIIPA